MSWDKNKKRKDFILNRPFFWSLHRKPSESSANTPPAINNVKKTD